MYDLIAIMIPIVLAVCIVLAIRIVVDARLRRHIVDAGADETLVKAIFSTDVDARRRRSLQWGVVMLAVGLGFAAMWWLRLDAENPLSYALLFVAGGLGMLLFRGLDPPAR